MQYFLTSSAPGIARGPVAGLGEYFDSGERDADQVLAVMRELGHGRTAKVLEFASGYGRVTRHLKLDDLTACDIHPEAVSLLRKKLKVTALLSTAAPANFDPARQYDFIFVLSLFSHLPDDLFGPWLAKLCSLLAPGGHLMFTTYGAPAAEKAPLLATAIDHSAGLTFLPHTDQPDLGEAIYGTAVVTQDYVRRKIAAATSGRLISVRECVWWQIQDEWIIAADA
jgi:SAM-dependent methyltransferase